MAIDHKNAVAVIDDMIVKLQTMRNAVLKHERPYIKVDAETVIPYTTDQKQGIIAVYGIIRANLTDLFKQLPEA
jgi:hypothetical protein